MLVLALFSATGCQWVAGFDDRHLAETPAGGQGGSSGAGGSQGGQAGQAGQGAGQAGSGQAGQAGAGQAGQAGSGGQAGAGQAGQAGSDAGQGGAGEGGEAGQGGEAGEGGQAGEAGAAGAAGAAGGAGGAGEGGAAGAGQGGEGGQAGEAGAAGEPAGGGGSGGAGQGGASGSSGQGGSAGSGVVGKRPPGRPDPSVPNAVGDRLVLAARRIHLGSYDPASCSDAGCKPDLEAWRSLGFDVDGRCTYKGGSGPQGCKQLIASDDGLGCIDNSLGFLLSDSLSQADIEGLTNSRIAEGGLTLVLEIEDLGKGADDPSAPGVVYLAAVADTPPKWDGSDVRKAEASSLRSGVLRLPLVRFPKGYLRDHTWVSGDLAAHEPTRLQLPLSVNDEPDTKDQVFDISVESATLMVPLDPSHKEASLAILSAVATKDELKHALMPVLLGAVGSCTLDEVQGLLPGLAIKAPDLSANAPGFASDQGFCDAISMGFGMAFSPVIRPSEVASTAPPFACGGCSVGRLRCNGGQPQQCVDQVDSLGFVDLDPCPPSSPLCVEGRCAAVAELACGNDHACARLSSQGPLDGKVYCWGAGEQGQTGQGVIANSGYPIEVLLPGKASQMASKNHHSCALLDDGSMHCWGDNLFLQIGVNAPAGNFSPPVLAPLPGDFAKEGVARIEVGFGFNCALSKVTGRAACRGANLDGQLGNGQVGLQPEASLVLTGGGQPLEGVEALSLGENHTCASKGGSLLCWGRKRKTDGCWGCPSPVSSNLAAVLAPAPVAGAEGLVGLVLGQGSTFALMPDGAVRAMGYNDELQLGFPSGDVPVFAQIPGVAGARTLTHSTGEFACTLDDAGVITCWGDNSRQQLGVALSPVSNELPPPVYPAQGKASQICAGGRATCAVGLDGALVCWGVNFLGQLGRGTVEPEATTYGDPAPVVWWP